MSKIYTQSFVLMFLCLKYTPCLSCPLVLLSKPPSPINFSLYHSKLIMIFFSLPQKVANVPVFPYLIDNQWYIGCYIELFDALSAMLSASPKRQCTSRKSQRQACCGLVT